MDKEGSQEWGALPYDYFSIENHIFACNSKILETTYSPSYNHIKEYYTAVVVSSSWLWTLTNV